jgi:hypothetical protein
LRNPADRLIARARCLKVTHDRKVFQSEKTVCENQFLRRSFKNQSQNDFCAFGGEMTEEQRDRERLFRLAQLLEQSETEASRANARALYQQAAQNGDVRAEQRLSGLTPPPAQLG